jgi:uncharacterized protein YndB with AHSA1/START domain
MSEVRLSRRIAARPDIVFDALTTTEGMTSWWGPDEGPLLSATADVKVGGRFQVRFRMLDGSEHECIGEFLEIDKPRRIVMSWQWIFGSDPGERERVSRLEFHLRAIDTGTELTLVHTELRDEETAHSHRGGWEGALDKLMRRLVPLEQNPAG